MQSVPACSLADIAAAARPHGLGLSQLVERAMVEAGRSSVERLYAGSNFCSQYFLNLSERLWRESFELCRREGIPATLIVPVFSQRDLAAGCSLVERLVFSYGDLIDEITVNDVGMLAFCLERFGCALNAGRLFSKVPRDPRYAKLFEERYEVDIPVLLTEVFRCGEVSGIEIDPTHAELSLAQMSGLMPHIQVGVHVPYCYLTTGAVCEIASASRPVCEKFRPNAPCSLECARCAVGYELPSGTRLLRWGRTVYFDNRACRISEGEDFRMIVSPIDELVRR